MKKEERKKLFIIQPAEYKIESFDPLFTEIENHFNRILNLLKISTPSGKAICIKLTVDVLNPEKVSAYAKRNNKDLAEYEIRINAGLSHYLWAASKTFAIPEYDILPWSGKCTTNDEIMGKLSQKEALANYAFFLSTYYVLLHEISHILLGHLDYLNDEMKLDYLSEFQDEKRRYSSEEIRIRKAFEAEADRQAGQWLVIFFENSLGKNRLGEYLLFPSRIHAYEFYVYAITIVFRVLQDLTQRKGVVHPKPNERLYILIASLSKYFRQNLPDEHDEIYIHAIKSCMEAGEKLLVVDSFAPSTVILNAHNLSFIDDVVREINIERYQHQFEFVITK